MPYAQLDGNGDYSHEITTDQNIFWDEKNYCSVAALIQDGKAEQFRVVELHEIEPPTIDSITQAVSRDGGEFVNGRWQYKWRVAQLTDAQIAVNIAAKNIKTQELIVAATQKRLDEFAQSKGYDNILSACTYATTPIIRFALEGQYCATVRSATWEKLYEILAEAESGTRPAPSSYSEIEIELPKLNWPV